jgi:pyruvate formate lyase activating enzyme
MADATTVRELLEQWQREGELFERTSDGAVVCYACGHRCTIRPGRDGICKVRSHRNGTLVVPWGYVAGIAVDPIEKKPFFHALPGSTALSFGMLGCDYHCAYCQNWLTSQVLRNPVAGTVPRQISAEQIVALALEHHTPVITSTYNEPLITSEWAVEVFRLAKKYNIRCSYVSNGNGTPEVIRYLKPHIDFFKIDLKSFRQKNYQQLGGTLQAVLDTIRLVHEQQIWLEVVTLVVPGWNDSDGELRDMATFLADVSHDIPWHVTAFHPDYHMTDPPATPAHTLLRAAEIGRTAGLRFVYTGNLPGMTGTGESTSCPSCQTLLIERVGFRIIRNVLRDGRCPSCTTSIPGIWH